MKPKNYLYPKADLDNIPGKWLPIWWRILWRRVMIHILQKSGDYYHDNGEQLKMRRCIRDEQYFIDQIEILRGEKK